MVRKMFFIGEPTSEQFREAKKMGYLLVPVKAPELKKDCNVEKLWMDLLSTLPIRKGDALCVTGAPQWIAWIVRMNEQARCYWDGSWVHPYFVNNEGERIFFDEISLCTVSNYGSIIPI